MNWLAHVFLSEQKIDFQIGNYLADPLKGKLWDDASHEMKKGIQTHMLIDAYTDSHRVVSKSKSRLREKGLLKPVIIDLTYDHLLTKNWEKFSSVPLREFLDTFNDRAIIRSNDLPSHAHKLVSNLAINDRLNRYHNLDQLKRSFESIDRRLSQRLLSRESAISYIDIVSDKIEELEDDFMTFFPELCNSIKPNLDEEHISHWKI
ncbi:ACP phosphodiesterase [Sulfurovum sp.]|uniref:ACP phosphodiesterase n=1 Tax=Sulfurovum sp. TaxID=1969726 RepID=UPI002867C8C0|nr:ACP phosphodiesterase [Sulfurovum sp.]